MNATELEKIVKDSLEERIFQIVPNFTSSHGQKYITHLLRHELEKKQTNQFYLYSKSFDNHIFNKLNISLLEELKEKSGDVKIILHEKLDNDYLSNSSPLRKIFRNKKEGIKPFPSISCIITENHFAEEFIKNDLDHNHKAVFFLNVDKVNGNSNDELKKIKHRKESLQNIFLQLWKRSTYS